MRQRHSFLNFTSLRHLYSAASKLYHEGLGGLSMSYWRGGAGGGGQRRGGRGGPNRGGGRHISGGGGGHPSGLKGRDIGLYYAKRSRANKKVTERNSVRFIFCLNTDQEGQTL